jgi:hypothetical protein
VPDHADPPEGAVFVPSEPSHRADVPDDVPAGRGRHRRRVTTDPPAGSDPAPAPEPPRHASTENDEQLKRDKPPHWG